ncbi:MAG: hypothetical protein Q7K28_02840 [Candidatus Wildermuthbacteria bacterium]|nr:hypothetical protein [Candidatus Wildermuthbacteria bacterium]
MQKIILTALILGVLAAASPALAETPDNSFWAAIGKMVQDFAPSGGEKEMNQQEGGGEGEMMDEDFVDPREVQQVQREIKDQRRELTRIAKQAKKLPNGGEIVNEINALLEQVAGFESRINQGIDLRDSIQEFRDAQIWQELNKIRARVEIPKEITQWQKELKRVEKMLGQKKSQNLGLNLDMARSKIEETKATLARVQEFYNNGDFESAMEEFDDLRQDFHPGEIMSVIQRMQELANRLKAVKNQDIKNQVQELFQEVIDNFNEGEYRVARELMDESWNDIMKVINQALLVGKKKGTSKQNFFQMTDKLQEQMKNKAEEKKVKMEEVREQREEKTQPAPQITPETTQPVQ